MKNDRPSSTATVANFWRALGHAGATHVRPGTDPFARELLPTGLGRRVYDTIEALAQSGPRARETFSRWVDLVTLRAVFLDEALAASTALQVVILGAGYDTRAWRLDTLRDRDVFEVDHAATQAEKRRRAASIGAPRCRSLAWVPMDFTCDDLPEVLARAGHRADVPSAWVWEAVIPYLDDDALDRTLAGVARASAPGSRLLAHYHEPHRARPGGVRLRLLRSFGEPQVGLRTRAQVAEALERAGLRVVEDLAGPEQAARIGCPAPENPLGRLSRVVVAEPA